MSVSQREKGERFRALHARPGAWVIPNAWDAGSARVLTRLGFEAIATTSAGLAFTLGRADGEGLVSRDETLANARAIVEATDLPVAADLENGFGDSPDDAATTIRRAGEEAGLVGGSIEDSTGEPARPIYDFDLAVARIAAAAKAARALPFPFTLVARAENYLHGRADLDDTLRRLRAYAAAGADALFVPGITTEAEIRAVCAATDRPVNVVTGLRGMPYSLAELGAMGVRRVSVGSALYRTGFGPLLDAARELRERGTFTFAERSVPFAEVTTWMERR